jgi:hypothetical protein
MACKRVNTTLPRSPLSGVAVLFAGELRLQGVSHLELLRAQCRNAAVFVVTFPAFEKSAHLLVSDPARLHIISPPQIEGNASRREALLPNGRALPIRPDRPGSVVQWAVLDAALRTFDDAFKRLSIQVIVRSRTDLIIGAGPHGDPMFRYASIEAERGALFAKSDLLFYADRDTFCHVFGDFFGAITRVYSRPPTGVDAERLRWRELSVREHSGCKVAESIAWAKAESPKHTSGMTKGYRFFSERAFSYHVIAAHGVPCMALRLKCSRQVRTPRGESPRYYSHCDPLGDTPDSVGGELVCPLELNPARHQSMTRT